MVVVRPHNKYNKNVVYDRFVFLCNIFYTCLSQILTSYISFINFVLILCQGLGVYRGNFFAICMLQVQCSTSNAMLKSNCP